MCFGKAEHILVTKTVLEVKLTDSHWFPCNSSKLNTKTLYNKVFNIS